MRSLTFAAALLLALTGPLMAQPLEGSWNSFNRTELEALIGSLGKGGSDYDPASPPYAVFDWDNTSVFLDVEEATLYYQLENLAFAATPAQLDSALRRGLPEDPEVKALTDDIIDSYAWLYLRLRAGGTVKEQQRKAHFKNFRAKFVRLYQLLEEKHGPEIAYPWMPFRFAGMTAKEVREVTRKAVEWQLDQPIETVEWSSPESLAGRAGVVKVRWRSGLRLLPEMQGLYDALRQAGFDVWICTASFVEGIREVSSSPRFGYLNPEDRVIGMNLKTDSKGRFLPEGVGESTYAKGKTLAIRRLLVERYGYGPALVCGDSDGDASMLVDFPDTRIGLIIETGQPAGSPIAKLAAQALAERGRPGARYLLQGRDETGGRLSP